MSKPDASYGSQISKTTSVSDAVAVAAVPRRFGVAAFGLDRRLDRRVAAAGTSRRPPTTM